MPPQVLKDVPPCFLCNEADELTIGKWSFKTGNTYLCGGTTNAGFIGTNGTFTLFGPSACSPDTGLVMTVYLPMELNEDKFNMTTYQVAFYYYDHNSAVDMFISRSTALFSTKLKSYIHATRIATGSFEGTVYKANGDTVYIREGRFKVLLK